MSRQHRTELFRAYREWATQKGWSPSTRNTYYERALAAELWLAENQGVSICFARPKDFKAYLFTCRPNPNVRNQIRNALLGFGEFLVYAGYAEENPALGLPRLPVKKGIPRALDRETVKKIVATARTLGYVHEAIVTLFLYTAIRREELRTLQWKSFEPSITAPEVWLRFTGKGNKERSIPLHGIAQKALAQWRLYNPDPQWVFPSPSKPGFPVTPPVINRWVNLVGESAGIRLHPHLFRHTCATALVDSGVDLRTVQEWLGHASVSTTAIYTKVHPKSLRAARDQLDFEKLPSEDDEKPALSVILNTEA